MLKYIALIIVMTAACSRYESKPRENRAALFATWAEPKAQCTPLTTALSLSEPDTALCVIKGFNHWCVAPAKDAPSCTPYGAPPPAEQPAAPSAPAEQPKGN